MRKTFCAACLSLLLLVPAVARADKAVEVWTKGGTKAYFWLGDWGTASVNFTETDMVISGDEQRLTLSLADCVRFTLRDVDPTGLNDVKADAAAQFRLADGRLEVSGLAAAAPVSLYSVDGRKVHDAKADAAGTVVVNLTTFVRGTYLVKAGSITCKILVQ